MPLLNKYNKRKYNTPWGYKRSILGRDSDGRAEVVEIVMNRKQETRLHYHQKVMEMFYIIKGSATIYVNNRPYRISEGDFLTIIPNERHKIIAEGDEVRILAVKIPGIEEDRIFLER